MVRLYGAPAIWSGSSIGERCAYTRVSTRRPLLCCEDSRDKMMTLTRTQHLWLEWLDRHGGRCRPCGQKLMAVNGTCTNTAAAISFVNLVAKGAVAGRDGYLEITEYGRRLLAP